MRASDRYFPVRSNNSKLRKSGSTQVGKENARALENLSRELQVTSRSVQRVVLDGFKNRLSWLLDGLEDLRISMHLWE